VMLLTEQSAVNHVTSPPRTAGTLTAALVAAGAAVLAEELEEDTQVNVISTTTRSYIPLLIRNALLLLLFLDPRYL